MGVRKENSWRIVGMLVFYCSLAIGFKVVFAKRPLTYSLNETSTNNSISSIYMGIGERDYKYILSNIFDSLFDNGDSSKKRVWPDLEFGWRVVLGSIIGFLGAALGSVGGVGGGGIFVPMLTLIIGFDPKTSTFCNMKVPIAVSVTLYEALCLCKGKRTIASRGKQDVTWKMHQLFLYCCCGVLAGIVGGLLGLGGGFILGPLFLEMGVPPQVRHGTEDSILPKYYMLPGSRFELGSKVRSSS